MWKVKATSNFRRNPLKPESECVAHASRTLTLLPCVSLPELRISLPLTTSNKASAMCEDICQRGLWLVFELGSGHVAVSAGLFSLPPEPGNLRTEAGTETKTEILTVKPQNQADFITVRVCV